MSPEARAALFAITDGICRWPEGDIRNRDFRFCCKPSDKGSVYCTAHREKAYIKQDKPIVK